MSDDKPDDVVDVNDEDLAWSEDDEKELAEAAADKGSEAAVEADKSKKDVGESDKKKNAEVETETESAPASEKAPEKASDARKQAEAFAKEMEDEEDRKLIKEAAQSLREKEPDGDKVEKTATGTQDAEKTTLIDGLADVEIQTLDEDGKEKKTTLGEFSEEYPEMRQIAVAVGEALSKRTIGEMEKRFEAVLSKVAVYEERFEREEYEKSRAELVETIEADAALGHPDANEIVYSDDFGKWFNEQDDALKKLGRIHDKRAAAVLLSAYKEDRGIKTVEKASLADRKRKEANDLHRGTMRTRAPKVGTSPKTQEEEEREAWENDTDD